MYPRLLLLVTGLHACLKINPCIKETEIKELFKQEMSALESINTQLQKEHDQKAADLKKINDEYQNVLQKVTKLESLTASMSQLKALVKNLEKPEAEEIDGADTIQYVHKMTNSLELHNTTITIRHCIKLIENFFPES